MLPILVIVGRPNVGKSTLFNRLTRTRDALVADLPGLTRDRHYGRGRVGDRRFIVVDTGGFEPVAKSGILHEMAKQTRAAIAEADAILFLVDGRAGLTEQDRTIAKLLRRSGRPVFLAVNKSEGLAPERAAAEFHELALGEPYPISSAHGENVEAVTELVQRASQRVLAAGPHQQHRFGAGQVDIGRQQRHPLRGVDQGDVRLHLTEQHLMHRHRQLVRVVAE